MKLRQTLDETSPAVYRHGEMESSKHPQWLGWTTRLQAIAQTGLTYGTGPFDIQRYTALREIVSEMLAAGSGFEIEAVRGILEKETGYATPKVDARGVVFRDGRLLLVRERSDGKWTLPGGWCDPCESAAENVVREIREESGFQTRAIKLLAVFDRSKHPHEPPFAFHVYKMFFLCALESGAETLSIETDAVEFFSESEIPELSINRVTPGQIRRMFEHHRDPSLPTDFD